jgi:hypothetical protein
MRATPYVGPHTAMSDLVTVHQLAPDTQDTALCAVRPVVELAQCGHGVRAHSYRKCNGCAMRAAALLSSTPPPPTL